MFIMQASGMTDTGRVRSNNEDAFTIQESLLIVADGMGGAAAGEIASSLAVDIISGDIGDTNMGGHTESEVEHILRKSIVRADNVIKQKSRENNELWGMGTTIVVGCMIDERMVLGYAGDSRAYVLSRTDKHLVSSQKTPAPSNSPMAETAILKPVNDSVINDSTGTYAIRRITRDHSVVMDLVDSGVINEDDIRTHPMRNRITRCVGNFRELGPDFVWYDIDDDDILIMCSDGLWEMVSEEIILAIARSSSTPEEICTRLVSAANDAGGHDNITVVAATFSNQS